MDGNDVNKRGQREIVPNTGKGEIETSGPYGPGDVAEEQKYSTEIIADIFKMLASDNEQAMKITADMKAMLCLADVMATQLSVINKNLRDAADSIAALADKPDEETPAKAPEQEAEVDHGQQDHGGQEQFVPLLVFHLATPALLAVCGKLGTPQQPFSQGLDHRTTSKAEDVNCPECLDIIAEKQAAEQKS